MTTKTTVNWWHHAPEIDEQRSEELNGGSGFASIFVSGGLGALQINSSDGAQINLRAEHGTIKYRSYRNHHGFRSHYISN